MKKAKIDFKKLRLKKDSIVNLTLNEKSLLMGGGPTAPVGKPKPPKNTVSRIVGCTKSAEDDGGE